MSRGGRRRRRTPGDRPAPGPDARPAGESGQAQGPPNDAAPQQGAEPAASAVRRRRRRRGREGGRPSAPAEGQGRPGPSRQGPSRQGAARRRATTLPPDGVILEDLIAAMQSEYGLPSTPQEYRLMVKVASREQAAAEEPRPRASAQAAEGQPAAARRRSRLRRRTRRPGAKPAGEAEAGTGPDAGAAPRQGKPKERRPQEPPASE